MGGWLDHTWKQLYIQIAFIVACSAYTFVMSAIIAKLIDMVPGLHLRASEEAELLGMGKAYPLLLVPPSLLATSTDIAF